MALKFEWRHTIQKIRINIAAIIKIVSFYYAPLKLVHRFFAFLLISYSRFSTYIFCVPPAVLHTPLFSHFQTSGSLPSGVIVMPGVPPYFFVRLGDAMTGTAVNSRTSYCHNIN